MTTQDLLALEAREQQRRLSRQDLLQPKIIEKEVEIAELGGTVLLKSLSYEVRSSIRKATGWGSGNMDAELFELMLIAESVIDPPLTVDDLQELKKQDLTIIDVLSVECSILNSPGRATELKKGLEEILNSDSP